jgi:hypothetical protein
MTKNRLPIGDWSSCRRFSHLKYGSREDFPRNFEIWENGKGKLAQPYSSKKLAQPSASKIWEERFIKKKIKKLKIFEKRGAHPLRDTGRKLGFCSMSHWVVYLYENSKGNWWRVIWGSGGEVTETPREVLLMPHAEVYWNER